MICCFLLLVALSCPYIGRAKSSELSGRDDAIGASVSTSPTPSASASENLRPVNTLSAAWHFDVGEEFERLGDFEDALAFYKEALHSSDSKLQSRAVKAVTDLLQKKRSMKRADDPKESYLGLGRLWKDRGKMDQAIAAYEKALEADSPQIRSNAAGELAALIKMKTTWWRQYATNPILSFFTSTPVVLILLAILGALLVRACIRRTDVLLIPNPGLSDTQWLPILIQDYHRQLTQTHGFALPRSSVPLVLFGHTAELFADLLSRVTKVDSSSWRQWFVKFFAKPRFELYLSLPSTNQGGIVTAALSKAGDVRDCFIREFLINDVPAIQKDLAFWVAYHIGRKEVE